jgi:hypothetical protein
MPGSSFSVNVTSSVHPPSAEPRKEIVSPQEAWGLSAVAEMKQVDEGCVLPSGVLPVSELRKPKGSLQ